MNLTGAILSIALLGASFYGYVLVVDEFQTRERYAFSSAFIRDVREGVYAWQAEERSTTDIQGWNFPTSSEDRNELRKRIPRNALEGDEASMNVVNTNALVFGDITHGAGHSFAFDWGCKGTIPPAGCDVVALVLFGNWEDDHQYYLQQLFPALTAHQSTSALCLGQTTSCLRIELPHPVSQNVLIGSLRRTHVQDGTSMVGLVAPLVFDGDAKTELKSGRGEPCTGKAFSVDEFGVPVHCVCERTKIVTSGPSASHTTGDVECDGGRVWRPIVSTDIYCRDLRLTVTGNAENYFQNSAHHIPIIETEWGEVAVPAPSSAAKFTARVSAGEGAICPKAFTPDPDNSAFCIKDF